jgi:hypothetical protein
MAMETPNQPMTKKEQAIHQLELAEFELRNVYRRVISNIGGYYCKTWELLENVEDAQKMCQEIIDEYAKEE